MPIWMCRAVTAQRDSQNQKWTGRKRSADRAKLSFAGKVADRFYIMDRGRDVAAGAMDQLSEDMMKRHLTV